MVGISPRLRSKRHIGSRSGNTTYVAVFKTSHQEQPCPNLDASQIVMQTHPTGIQHCGETGPQVESQTSGHALPRTVSNSIQLQDLTTEQKYTLICTCTDALLRVACTGELSHVRGRVYSPQEHWLELVHACMRKRYRGVCEGKLTSGKEQNRTWVVRQPICVAAFQGLNKKHLGVV